MVPFLKQVAVHYFRQGNVGRRCFVFPNRRAMVFFKKYLGECVSAGGTPIVSPQMYTMNDFFYRITGKSPASREQLILRLYDCYKKFDRRDEELDDFIFWGGVLLSDFNDVDKYLVDADRLFTNVSDFKSMLSPEEYLDETQLEALNRFLSHFRTGGSYKTEFLRTWEIMRPLYHDFNESLSHEGLAYEGQVYRELAEKLSEHPVKDILADSMKETDDFVFVGLNALNECEKRLLSKLRDAGLAEFCWDYSSEMIKDSHNKSSFFMARNIQDFKPSFTIDPQGLEIPEINAVSVPSAIGQTKQIPAILDRFGEDIGINTAVVLPDEGLLIPVLNSIPEYIKDINVTMGYPMNGSELWSLMNELSSLQIHLRYQGEEAYFYHRQVWAVFSNSIFKTVISDSGRETVERIKKSTKYYIPIEDFRGDSLLELIFTPVVKDPSEHSADLINSLEEYGKDIILHIAPILKEKEDMSLELDFAKEYFQAIGRLQACRLEIRPATYFRMLGQLVGNASVPFKGEPLKGLQIMGPLETRALDFENVILLNSNEGIFPRRAVSPSFIPPELRKGFDLPTYEYQDAVWAYYFYRMIQRSRRVWMLYDSRTEVSKSGEPSRYISQLELHFGVKVNRFVVKSRIEKGSEESSIPKTEEDIALIKGKYLSATRIQDYEACPAKFYYRFVRGLREKDEVVEVLDAGKMGTVFHSTMESLYRTDSGIISKSYLETLISKENPRIRNEVKEGIKKKLNSFEVTGRNLIYEDIICRYVEKTLQRDLELMESYGVKEFRILGLELHKNRTIDGFLFKGDIDRLDSFVPGEVRVVDYKTGSVDRDKVDLQLFLYDRLISQDGLVKGKHLVNSVYHLSRMFVEKIENEEMDSDRKAEMETRLEAVLSELADPSVPFRRTDDVQHTCSYCEFKMICGR